MPSLFNSIFTALSPEYVAIVVAFVLIGQKVLVEKKRVPGVMCVIGLTVGAYLGYGVYGLDMTEVVISGFLVGLGIALMLSIELTMVGYAVLALIAGFFLGHKMGVAFGEDYPGSVMPIFLNLSGLTVFYLSVLISKVAMVNMLTKWLGAGMILWGCFLFWA